MIVEWFFPGVQQRSIHKIYNKLSPRVASSERVLSKEYVKDDAPVFIDGKIDTALLPLRVKVRRVSDLYAIPKSGGSITAVEDIILIVDRLGNFYSCQSDGSNLVKLEFPPFSNHLRDYISHVGAKYNDNSLRVHDLLYLEPNKSLAISFEAFDPSQKLTRLVVATIKVDVNNSLIKAIGPWEVVFESDLKRPSNIVAGGQMALSGADTLFISVGDYFIKTPNNPQNTASSFGKIFEIRLDSKKARVVSLGHRNPQGLFMTRRGQLFSTEHGPMGGDELNQIVEGGNYGWPNVTLGTEYGTYGWQQDGAQVGSHSSYIAPLFAWVPSIAVTSVLEVQYFHPRWSGDLLVASLKGEMLNRLRVHENRILYSEPIWIGQRIRDLTQTRNGTIVLWSEDTQVYFMTVDETQLSTNSRATKLINETLDQKCMFCHHFGPSNATHLAPSLSGIFTRKIASDNFRYTEALRLKEGRWTEYNLRDFLTEPNIYAAGTSMPDLNLSQQNIEEIIEVLKGVPASDASIH